MNTTTIALLATLRGRYSSLTITNPAVCDRPMGASVRDYDAARIAATVARGGTVRLYDMIGTHIATASAVGVEGHTPSTRAALAAV